jgi:AcrR family transcriptional regulator
MAAPRKFPRKVATGKATRAPLAAIAGSGSRKGHRHTGSAGAREPLSRERIVDAALALIDQTALDMFSTRKLGEALGVEAMSIYHHFASKQHLLDALVDHAIASVKLPPPGPDPIGRLWRACLAYRAMARRFPKLYPLIALHRLNTPTGVRFIERILELIAAVTPEAEQAARSFRAIGYYLTGASLEETSGYAKGPSAAEPVDDAYIAAHCPRLMRVAPYFKEQHWERTFEAGLAALILGFGENPNEPAIARAARMWDAPRKTPRR